MLVVVKVVATAAASGSVVILVILLVVVGPVANLRAGFESRLAIVPPLILLFFSPPTFFFPAYDSPAIIVPIFTIRSRPSAERVIDFARGELAAVIGSARAAQLSIFSSRVLQFFPFVLLFYFWTTLQRGTMKLIIPYSLRRKIY